MSCIKTVRVHECSQLQRVEMTFDDCSLAEAIGFLNLDDPRLDVHVLLEESLDAHQQSKRLMVVHTHPKGYERDAAVWNSTPDRMAEPPDEM